MPFVSFLPLASAPLAMAADEWSDSTVLTLAGLGLLALWPISLLLHPFTTCGSCQGTPRSYGSVATRFQMADSPHRHPHELPRNKSTLRIFP